ncbi:MAG: hypothetical protein EA364_09535 [Balneolaceae bacterium]|nr:MAG: hypothetical protein EA364_09535 [Balneolaceae bacterium]
MLPAHIRIAGTHRHPWNLTVCDKNNQLEYNHPSILRNHRIYPADKPFQMPVNTSKRGISVTPAFNL